MGTEVLRPQDCLIGRIRDPHPSVFHRRRSFYPHCNPNYVSNPRSSRKSAVRSEKPDQRKRFVSQSEPSVSRRSGSSDDSKTQRKSLSMEKVTILRRGESLDSKIKSEGLGKQRNGLAVHGTERLGPDRPEMLPKQIRIADPRPSPPPNRKCDVYAGSAFAVSPEPSSLPLPSFSKKKQVSAVVDDSATRDLRRLLRLDI